MLDSLKITSLESQVATLTALVAELQKRVGLFEALQSGEVRIYNTALAELQQRVTVLEERAALRVEYGVDPVRQIVNVPDFTPPLAPESSPRGPQAG